MGNEESSLWLLMMTVGGVTFQRQHPADGRLLPRPQAAGGSAASLPESLLSHPPGCPHVSPPPVPSCSPGCVVALQPDGLVFLQGPGYDLPRAEPAGRVRHRERQPPVLPEEGDASRRHQLQALLRRRPAHAGLRAPRPLHVGQEVSAEGPAVTHLPEARLVPAAGCWILQESARGAVTSHVPVFVAATGDVSTRQRRLPTASLSVLNAHAL